MLVKRDRRYVAALCMELWEWVDESTTDGRIPNATPEQVDIIVDFPGFGDALVAVGWMIRTPNGIEIPNFTRHNGETAKSRALAALRKANQRKKELNDPNQRDASVTNVTVMSRSERDKSVTREEKRREETESSSSSTTARTKSSASTTFVATDGGNPPPAAPTQQPQTSKPASAGQRPNLRFRWEASTGFVNLPESTRLAWERAFPACDIDAELAKAHAWMLANPTKIKSNWDRFAVNWLKRAQDSGGTNRKAPNNRPDDVIAY